MKKKFSLLALALASCVTALAGSPLTSQAAEIPQLGPSRIWGTMTKSGNDTIIFDNQSGESYQGGYCHPYIRGHQNPGRTERVPRIP